MNVIAIDLGGSHAVCALVCEKKVLAKFRIEITDNAYLRPVLADLHRCVAMLLKDERSPDCRGIAVSFCGIVDSRTGRIKATNGKYQDGREIDFVEWSRTSFDLPLRLENDARTALIGERYAGSAQGFDDVVMVTLGTGVGGAAMMSGQLIRGRHSQGGCLLGHFVSDRRGGRLCSCGNIGCVEAEASTWALPILCAEHPGYQDSPLAALSVIGFEELFSFAETGDICSIEIRDHCLEVWAAAAVSYIHAYDPELIIFGGGVMSVAHKVIPSITAYVDAHAWTPWGKVQIRSAALGNEASLLSAVPLFEGVL